MNFPGFVFSTFIMTAVAGSALAQMDGRTGPATMTGAQLDIALGHLNDHLQARYAQDDILAGLSTPPDADFVTVAAAATTTPMAKRVAISGSFGPEISDNASLMAHLISFNAERTSRGDDLFLRIARAEAGKLPGFESIASDVFASAPVGGIMDDPTLERELRQLNANLQAFDERAERLGAAVPAIDDRSFDRYTDALRLF